MKNIPVLSFLWRSLSLVLAFVAAFFLFKWEAAFQSAGPMIYAPTMFILAVLLALLVRHLFWRNSVDEYARSGGFLKDWNSELSPVERVRWTIGITLGLIFCASIIAAAIAK